VAKNRSLIGFRGLGALIVLGGPGGKLSLKHLSWKQEARKNTLLPIGVN